MKKKKPIKISKVTKNKLSKSVVFSKIVKSSKIMDLSKIDSDSENHEIDDCVNPLDDNFGLDDTTMLN